MIAERDNEFIDIYRATIEDSDFNLCFEAFFETTCHDTMTFKGICAGFYMQGYMQAIVNHKVEKK